MPSSLQPAGTTTTAMTPKKGSWTPAEDALLLEFVDKYGDANWNNAHLFFPGLRRGGKSCRMRYRNQLRHGLRKGPFTPAEQLLVSRGVALYGNQWSKIADMLPGRTDNSVKNFWNVRLKRLKRQRSAALQAADALLIKPAPIPAASSLPHLHLISLDRTSTLPASISSPSSDCSRSSSITATAAGSCVQPNNGDPKNTVTEAICVNSHLVCKNAGLAAVHAVDSSRPSGNFATSQIVRQQAEDVTYQRHKPQQYSAVTASSSSSSSSSSSNSSREHYKKYSDNRPLKDRVLPPHLKLQYSHGDRSIVRPPHPHPSAAEVLPSVQTRYSLYPGRRSVNNQQPTHVQTTLLAPEPLMVHISSCTQLMSTIHNDAEDDDVQLDVLQLELGHTAAADQDEGVVARKEEEEEEEPEEVDPNKSLQGLSRQLDSEKVQGPVMIEREHIEQQQIVNDDDDDDDAVSSCCLQPQPGPGTDMLDDLHPWQQLCLSASCSRFNVDSTGHVEYDIGTCNVSIAATHDMRGAANCTGGAISEYSSFQNMDMTSTNHRRPDKDLLEAFGALPYIYTDRDNIKCPADAAAAAAAAVGDDQYSPLFLTHDQYCRHISQITPGGSLASSDSRLPSMQAVSPLCSSISQCQLAGIDCMPNPAFSDHGTLDSLVLSCCSSLWTAIRPPSA